MNPSDEPDRRDDDERAWDADDLERASENVLEDWPSAQLEDPPGDPVRLGTADAPADAVEPGPAPPPEPEAAPEPATAVAATPTRIIDKPLRSGQRVYAAGGDIVVLAAVNPGAEVIADGSIHVYAPLKGRALAGARGDTTARIFTTHLEAELVSIAGVYRTFDSAPDAAVAKKPAQIRLADASQIVIEPL